MKSVLLEGVTVRLVLMRKFMCIIHAVLIILHLLNPVLIWKLVLAFDFILSSIYFCFYYDLSFQLINIYGDPPHDEHDSSPITIDTASTGSAGSSGRVLDFQKLFPKLYL